MLRILSGGKCAVSEREICLQVEKNEVRLRVEHADLATVCLTAVKFRMFGDKTPHVWHPIRTCCFVSYPRLDQCNRRYILSITKNWIIV